MRHIRKTGLYLLSIFALAGSTAASAADAGHYASSSVLSSGRWVKIRVNESGIQQITHEQLREWGFDDPSAVTVYGFGGVAGAPELLDESIPDDLPQQPVVYRDDRLLFYGESNCRPNLVYFASKPSTVAACPDVERNNVADAGYYFITDSQPRHEVAQIPYKPLISTPFVRNHWEISMIEEELTNPIKQGQLYFGRDISQDSDTLRYSFPLDELYFESGVNYAKLVFHDIVVASGSNLTFTLTYPHRDSTISKTFNLESSNAHVQFSSNAANSDSYLALQMPKGTTTFDVTLSKAARSTFTYAAVDRLVMAYQRNNNLGDRPSMILFDSELANGRVIEVADADPGVIVWNVDRAYNVRPYESVYNNAKRTVIFTNAQAYKISSKTDPAHRTIAFNPAKEHLPVEYAGEIDNQNVHSYDVPDMVILSADALVDQAERLAQIHRDLLGHDVVVLRQDEIFNEFSSGTPSLWGIRKAMKMFYDRNPSKMKHLLLFGGAFYDNRGFTTTGASFKEQGMLLLNYGSPNHKTMGALTTGYSCDAYFGMLGDVPPSGEFINNVQHINVGRIPVTDLPSAAKAVDKVYQYLTYTPSTDIYQRVLLITDEGDSNQHLLSGEVTGDSFLANNPGITLIKGYSSLYPLSGGKALNAKNAIKQALKNGVMYVNYTGHGRPDAIGSKFLYELTDVRDTQYGYFPFAMLATCQAYTFDCLGQSIAQDLVLQNNGGMIGVIAACREVYQTRNQILSEKMADIFAKSPQGTTTGDILRLSRNALLGNNGTGDNDLMINTSCYNLCGDPAIPLFFAGHKIAIESVNGEKYNAEEGHHSFTPLASNTITGYVESPSNPGTPWSSFDGNVILSIYEPAIKRSEVLVSTSPEKGDSIRNIITDEDLLIEVNAKVAGGKFAVEFMPPMPMRTGAYNRATITAVLPDNSEVATTYTKALFCDVDSAPGQPADTEAPEITELYIDTPQFVSGDITGKEFTVYATVTDNGSGIYTSTGSVGPTCRISVDNTMNYPVVGTAISNNGDGTVDISFPFSSLSDGRHTLTLHISDNAGNSASRSIDFIINDTSASPVLKVEEEPARIQATISLQGNFTGTPTGRLLIEDETGREVFTRADVSFPFEWDLTDGNGNLVKDGVYRAYAICKGDTQYGATPKTDIIVVQQP